MFEIPHLLTYILVVLTLFLVPGPAVILTITQSLTGGRKIGLATGLGIATGDAVHTTLATLGLSALLMTSAVAFRLVKYAGVAYLVTLGIRAWITPPADAEQPDAQAQPVSTRHAFRRALWTEVLNPRTALFFLAFLPQFVQTDKGSVTVQFLVLGLIFCALSICYTSLLAVAAGSLGTWLTRQPGLARWQGKVTGSVYIGLGIRLLLQRQG